MGGVGDKCLEVKIRQKDDRYGQRGVKSNAGGRIQEENGRGEGKKGGKENVGLSNGMRCMQNLGRRRGGCGERGGSNPALISSSSQSRMFKEPVANELFVQQLENVQV